LYTGRAVTATPASALAAPTPTSPEAPGWQAAFQPENVLAQVEALGPWTPPQATLVETIANEQAWAAQSIACLRRLIPG